MPLISNEVLIPHIELPKDSDQFLSSLFQSARHGKMVFLSFFVLFNFFIFFIFYFVFNKKNEKMEIGGRQKKIYKGNRFSDRNC